MESTVLCIKIQLLYDFKNYYFGKIIEYMIVSQLALWRVLDIYKRGAKLRGQAPAKTTHFNSDKRSTQSRADRGVRR